MFCFSQVVLAGGRAWPSCSSSGRVLVIERPGHCPFQVGTWRPREGEKAAPGTQQVRESRHLNSGILFRDSGLLLNSNVPPSGICIKWGSAFRRPRTSVTPCGLLRPFSALSARVCVCGHTPACRGQGLLLLGRWAGAPSAAGTTWSRGVGAGSILRGSYKEIIVFLKI